MTGGVPNSASRLGAPKARARAWRWRWGALALAVGLAACGERAPAPAIAADAGAEGPQERPPEVPSASEVHARSIRALLGELAPEPLPEALTVAPIQRLRFVLDDAAARFEGELEVALINTTGAPLTELAFFLAPALGIDPRAGRPPLAISEVRVRGRAVEPRGDAEVLRIPVEVAPGAQISVSLRFSGAPPELPRARWGRGRADADALFELVAGSLSAPRPFGRRAGALVLAGAYPMLAPLGHLPRPGARADELGWTAPSHFEVIVDAPRELGIVASGVEVSRERAGDTRVRTRFVAVGAREVALVAARGLASEGLRAGVVEIESLYTPTGRGRAAEIARVARRAVEVYEGAWGPCPQRRVALVQAPLPGSVGGLEVGGLVLISDLFSAASAEVDADDPLLAVLAHHPQLRESLEFIVARQVARLWWGELVATDEVASPWVGEALASVGALRYFTEAHGKKAARRQRTLELALSYQLARYLGGEDRPVASHLRQLRAPLEVGGVAFGKAGLYLDAQRRAMSDGLYLDALRGARARYAQGVMSGEALEALLVDASPRPEAARQLAQRWLHGTTADEDIGPLRPALLVEYLAGDALVDGGAEALLQALASNAQFGELVDALLSGGEGGQPGLDVARLLPLLGKALGVEVDPELTSWAELLTEVAEGDSRRWGPAAVDKLLELVGEDLGVDERERALLSGAARVLFDAPIDAGAAPAAPDAGAAPPDAGP